jgi:hypothetical protein
LDPFGLQLEKIDEGREASDPYINFWTPHESMADLPAYLSVRSAFHQIGKCLLCQRWKYSGMKGVHVIVDASRCITGFVRRYWKGEKVLTAIQLLELEVVLAVQGYLRLTWI